MTRHLPALLTAAVVLGAMSGAAPSRADVLGPLLPPRVMEAGAAWRELGRTVRYSRYFDDSHDTFMEQEQIALFGRYGLTSHATLGFELSVTPDELAFTDGDGALYLVGAAMQFGIWTDGPTALTFGFHYASYYWRDDQLGHPDIEEQLLEWTLLLQRTWAVKKFSGMLWAGPAASHFSLEQQLPFNNDYQQPLELYGGMIGANARFADHVGMEVQWLYVENGELDVALFYRF